MIVHLKSLPDKADHPENKYFMFYAEEFSANDSHLMIALKKSFANYIEKLNLTPTESNDKLDSSSFNIENLSFIVGVTKHAAEELEQ